MQKRKQIMFGIVAGVVAGLWSMTGSLWAQANLAHKVEIAWNRLYNYGEVAELMQRLATAYPEFCRVESIGKSVEGRDMWLMTLQNPATGPEDRKCAMWVDGNIHGNEVQGAEAAIYLAWYLLDNYQRNDKAKELLDTRVFYVLPMVNPDGRAYWFDAPNDASSSRSGKRPTDSDRDGLFDEDGPDDLDGDGSITSMRKRVPDGTLKEDPSDPMGMVPVKPGEKGTFIMLGDEGIDNDGDGRINEDPAGGYDMNRNWPSDWLPNYLQGGAGDFPFSYPETHSIGMFLLAHPNIAGFQSFHNNGGMILRGPGAQTREGLYPSQDVRVYDEIGKTGEEMLPFYRYMIIYKDLYTVHGGSVNWAYEGLGIFAFTNELWNDRQYYGKEAPGSTADRRFDELLLLGDTFVKWHPAKHPLYGDIEVGGFKKMTSRVPPPFMIEEMSHRNALFTLYHADQMPKLAMSDLEIEKVGTDSYLVTAEAQNEKLIPTRAALASQKKIGRPDLFQIEGENLQVISGGSVQDRFQRNRVRLVEKDPARLKIEGGLSGRGREKVRWLIRGQGWITVSYDAEKGGYLAKKAKLP